MKRARLLPVIVAVTVVTVTVGARGAQEGASRDLLALVPADAAVVMWTDFAALGTEGGRRFLPPMLPGGAGLDLLELAAVTGINPQQDVRELVLALVDATEEGTVPPGHGVVIARVDYRHTRLPEVLGDKPTSTYRDHVLYRVDLGGLVRTPPGSPGAEGGDGEAAKERDRAAEERDRAAEEDTAGSERRRARARQRAGRQERQRPPGAVALLGDDLMVVGTLDGVRAALDVVDGERPSFLAAGALAEHVRAVPPGRDTIVAISGEALDAAVRLYSESNPRSPLATGLLPRLRGVLLSADPGAGMEATLTALLPTEQDAQMLAESVAGLLALWKMSLQQEDPELLAAVDRSLDVQHRAERVDVEVSVSPEDSLLLQARLMSRFGDWFQRRGETGNDPEDMEPH